MLKLIAKGILRIGGWTTVGEIPKFDKAIFVVAPHTSNWDGIWALAFVVSHWPAVQAVADALWRKRTLSGDEVREIIARIEARTNELPPYLAALLGG